MRMMILITMIMITMIMLSASTLVTSSWRLARGDGLTTYGDEAPGVRED